MEYIGKIEYDKKIRNGTGDIVIFGAGNMLRELLGDLEMLGIKNRVVCICDNSSEVCGKTEDGIFICSASQVFKDYKDADYIVYNKYSLDICRQLMENGIAKIHFIRR